LKRKDFNLGLHLKYFLLFFLCWKEKIFTVARMGHHTPVRKVVKIHKAWRQI